VFLVPSFAGKWNLFFFFFSFFAAHGLADGRFWVLIFMTMLLYFLFFDSTCVFVYL